MTDHEMTGRATLTAAPELSMFVGVDCGNGRRGLVDIEDVYVSMESGSRRAHFSYTCGADGRLNWGEVSRETAGLLIGLGAATEPRVVESVGYEKGEVA